jgi:hypothetical protein
MLAQGLNRPANGIPEPERDLGKTTIDKIVPKLSNHIVAGGFPIENLHELLGSRTGLVFCEQGVCLFVYGTPEFRFGDSLRCQSFCKHGIEFIRRPGKTRYSALFDGGQGSVNNFLYGFVNATTQDGLNPLLLFWREMNYHAVRAPVLVAFPPSFSLGENVVRCNH